ncbi:MAG: hypothetical protein CVU72_03245 [Deltaproteobacteria bacterium HGW-Deltaproteobacteria-7]|nr:MAG: hypothetical protein CVU72_03245 [Deltaproteobacteria bacterium HGW-Deltaproteobacteria-7]PKN52184.1 MAG: hypothetical protein CVU55_07810 [Deltaproteobacteria bacterium HGW-Deltaproteobacteria-13]
MVFFDKAEKGLSRIYPVQAKRETGSRDKEGLGFSTMPKKALVEFIPFKRSAKRDKIKIGR